MAVMLWYLKLQVTRTAHLSHACIGVCDSVCILGQHTKPPRIREACHLRLTFPLALSCVSTQGTAAPFNCVICMVTVVCGWVAAALLHPG